MSTKEMKTEARTAPIDDAGNVTCTCGWSYQPTCPSDVQFTSEVRRNHVWKHFLAGESSVWAS